MELILAFSKFCVIESRYRLEAVSPKGEGRELAISGSVDVDCFIYECATVITTFPFLCPCSTYLKASAIRSKG